VINAADIGDTGIYLGTASPLTIVPGGGLSTYWQKAGKPMSARP
jgi:hypothetical protein